MSPNAGVIYAGAGEGRPRGTENVNPFRSNEVVGRDH